MLSVISLSAIALGMSGTPHTDICVLGQAIVRDLLVPTKLPLEGSLFVDADAKRPSLLTACPELQSQLPTGYVIARKSDEARAQIAVPTVGEHFLAATMYSIGIPTIAADHKSATVQWAFTCTGLCGASFVSHYLRSSTGWHPDGKPQIISVS